MNEHDGNVAFKCTYNDGGERGFVGFNGACSDGNIMRNVKAGRRWCSAKANTCRQFYENDFKGQRPQRPCYESEIIERWRFGPGTYHTEGKDEVPIPMKFARKGKVALLTTRHPDRDSENQRIVFGLFKMIKVIDEGDSETWVEGSPDHAIRLSETAAFALPYWRFKTPPKGGAPAWGTGLFRYTSDEEVANFLYALFPYLQDAQDRAVLEHLLDCCGNPRPEALEWKPNHDISDADLKFKYGPGGEGNRHRHLKELIARDPDMLNLGPGDATVEHHFMTGDRVDVSIDLDSGEHCVVEIEVEGQSTLIGAHQALKYRALRAAQLNTTKQPHAFLVAYSIPQSIREFCERHGVAVLEIPQG